MKPSDDSTYSMWLLSFVFFLSFAATSSSRFVNVTCMQVRLTPTLEVYAQLSKPDGIREGSMPYTAWKCMTQLRALPTGIH